MNQYISVLTQNRKYIFETKTKYSEQYSGKHKYLDNTMNIFYYDCRNDKANKY